MVCKQCSGLMTIDKKNKMLICPYCGSTEPFDNLSKDEMQEMITEAVNDVREENIKMVKKIEESNKKAIAATRTESSARFIAALVLLSIFLVILLIVVAFSFDSGMIITGIYSSVQFCLVFATLIIISKAKTTGNARLSTLGIILIVVSFLSVIPGFIIIATDNENKYSTEEKDYVWPEIGLGSNLPDPKLPLTYLYYSDSYLTADIENVDINAYTDYVKKVADAGYNIDAVTDDSKYIAYDKNDNEVTVNLYYGSKISIRLNKALEFTDFYWPKSGGIQYMPEPKVDKICLKSMYDTNAELYIRDMTKSDFMKYIGELQDAGFKGSYNSNEFRGEKDDVNITMQFQRDSIVYIKSYIYKRDR